MGFLLLLFSKNGLKLGSPKPEMVGRIPPGKSSGNKRNGQSKKIIWLPMA